MSVTNKFQSVSCIGCNFTDNVAESVEQDQTACIHVQADLALLSLQNKSMVGNGTVKLLDSCDIEVVTALPTPSIKKETLSPTLAFYELMPKTIIPAVNGFIL